jgi:hypothetical protein
MDTLPYSVFHLDQLPAVDPVAGTLHAPPSNEQLRHKHCGKLSVPSRDWSRLWQVATTDKDMALDFGAARLESSSRCPAHCSLWLVMGAHMWRAHSFTEMTQVPAGLPENAIRKKRHVITPHSAAF